MNNNVSSFDIKLSKFSNIPQIIDLIKGFEYPFSKEHYEWKYLQCPWDSVSIICEIENEVIGHCGNSIRPFLIKNQQRLLGLNADAIIKKDYRRKGVLSKIEPVIRQEGSKKGVEYNYAFPNVYTFPFTLKFNYEVIGYIPIYLKILHMKTVIKCFSKIPYLPHFSSILSLVFHSRPIRWPNTIEIKKVTSYPNSLDVLWNRVLSDPKRLFQNIGFRTKKYLEWRFRSCPDRDYKFIVAHDQSGELRGYAVLRELEVENLREGAIIDIFHSPFDQETSIALISYAHDYFIKADVDLIACNLSETPTCIPNTLRKFGFLRFIKRFNPRPWVAVIRKTVSDIPVDPSLIDPQKWYLTWGDNDLF